MNEYAPAAIRAVYTAVKLLIPKAQLSGVLGDRNHTYGYHRARAVLPASDYSVKLAKDKQGDKWAASALDISLPKTEMIRVTKRLIDSANDRNDPRMEPVREFYGTTNGTSVNGRIHDGNYSWRFASADNSHLWHIHIGFIRKYANDAKALIGVAEVITGKALDMALDVNDVKTIINSDIVPAPNTNPSKTTNPEWTMATYLRKIMEGVDKLSAKSTAEYAALVAAIDQLARDGGVDPEAIKSAALAGAKQALADLTITWSAE